MPGRTDRDRRGLVVPAVAAVALAAGGLVLAVAALSHASPPPSPSAADAAPVTVSPGPVSSSAASSASLTGGLSGDLHAKTLPRSAPVRLMIPSIGLDTGPLVGLGVDSHGALEVPRSFEQAGWYTPGPAPGQYGPAVIAGHVDSTTGPAVFYRLGALHKNAIVMVRRADGSTARFTVDRVVTYPKRAFPTASVYGDTTHRAELRLITCGGPFDARTGHYEDNIVAYAHLL